MRIANAAKTLIWYQGKILVIRRSSTDNTRPGEWDLPGGSIEGDETFSKAAAREISEEVGISVPVDKLTLVYCDTRLSRAGHESVNRFIYTTTLKAEPSVSLSFEHDQWKFVEIDEFFALYDHPVYPVALRYVLDNSLLG